MNIEDQYGNKIVDREKVIMEDAAVPDEAAHIPDGWYKGKFVDYEVKHDVEIPVQYQTEDRKTQDRITLWFEVDGIRVRRTVNKTWGPRSNFKKLMAGMLGKKVDERFGVTLEELIGTECMVEIVQNEPYTNVERAKPLAKAKK